MGKSILSKGRGLNGSNGIGKEIVRAYAEHGHNVIFADVDQEEGHSLSQLLKGKKLEVEFFRADVRFLYFVTFEQF